MQEAYLRHDRVKPGLTLEIAMDLKDHNQNRSPKARQEPRRKTW